MLDLKLQFSRDYQQRNAELVFLPLAQFVECMEGETEYCDVLVGRYMDEDKDLGGNGKGDRPYRHCTYVFRVFMLSILGMHEAVLEVHRTYEKLHATKDATVSSLTSVITMFHLAMVNLGLARMLASKQHRNEAKQYVKVLKKLGVVGSPLICSMLVLIRAEQAALKQKVDQAMSLYKQAIEEFGAQKLLWYKLMSLERTGDFCLSHTDVGSGRRYLRTVYNEYEMMGVRAKLSKLREYYKDVDFDVNDE